MNIIANILVNGCRKGGDVVGISYRVGLGAGDVVGNCVCLSKGIVKER